MRGKRMKDAEKDGYLGITPADAGKTKFPALLQFLPQDHPRGCGENLDNFPLSNISRGSPPRMRGKPVPLRPVCPIQGITPADAGKTNAACILYNAA